MKKIIALFALIIGFSGTSLMAQQREFDPAKMKERELQRLKQSDLKLTDEQADSVASINLEMRTQMRGFRDLSQEERQAKMKEMNDYRMKRWSAALKDENLAKKVAEYYEKQRANRANQQGNQQ